MPSHCLASFPCYSNKDPSNPMNKQPELSSVYNECTSSCTPIMSQFYNACNGVVEPSNVTSTCATSIINKTDTSIQLFPVQKTDPMIWYKRLGHPNKSILTQILKHLQIPSNKKSDITFCQVCQFGKMHQSTYPKSTFHATKPLELVYSDLWGSSLIPSPEGFKYYI